MKGSKGCRTIEGRRTASSIDVSLNKRGAMGEIFSASNSNKGSHNCGDAHEHGKSGRENAISVLRASYLGGAIRSPDPTVDSLRDEIRGLNFETPTAASSSALEEIKMKRGSSCRCASTAKLRLVFFVFAMLSSLSVLDVIMPVH